MRSCLILLLGFSSLVLSAQEPQQGISIQTKESDQPTIEVVVHRGANKLAPENTFSSAAMAIELGADYVECDVRRSRDGVYYLMHDMTVKRTTNGDGYLWRLNSNVIDTLDAGSWFGEEFTGEKVPRLKEFLLWIKGKAKVYIDVKAGQFPELIDVIREVGMEDEVFFWLGGGYYYSKLFRASAPDIALKVNAKDMTEATEAKQQWDAQIIECPLATATPEFIDSCHTLGMKVMIYETKNDLKTFEKIIDSGADMVNLDDVMLFFQLMNAYDEKGNMRSKRINN